MELRHTIAYVNDAVIPQVRRESISAMRNVAETLRNLADRIEQASNGAQPSQRPRDPPSLMTGLRNMQESPGSWPPLGWAFRCLTITGCGHHKNVALAPSPNELAPYMQPTYVPFAAATAAGEDSDDASASRRSQHSRP